MDEAVQAVYMEMVGQTFAVLGMAIAKLSLGIFLLRIVVCPWSFQTTWPKMETANVCLFSLFVEDTVPLIIWSAVELAVTLICVGIPTIRPLYRYIVHGSSVKESHEVYKRQDESGSGSGSRGKPTFAMPMRNFARAGRKDELLTTTTTTVDIPDANDNRPDGNSRSYVTGAGQNDEEALVATIEEENSRYRDHICVRQEVHVERN
ncbi:unnamed protein product [Aspergillus oryzae]|uniref:Unnamed protein product n=1 Tax=Aspergillus oryzae var. brunneus TaxID=332754 RepID=A0ABQ6KY77_ASPOZ|nr:unnamed protein product [Aspergillus oryzae]GMF93115.1 unnamed protein product [Aspergillus oryzae]GMG17158.1 unnamed protein product [Aspergillus oryzae]GMG47035.1 unnamed protein product [Aspergillus oryzae var. brunneus]